MESDHKRVDPTSRKMTVALVPAVEPGTLHLKGMREIKESSVTFGSCNQTAKQGESLHCYDHCLAFITATADERLRQVQRHGDCTICLQRDHDGQAHIPRAAGKTDKMLTCSL